MGEVTIAEEMGYEMLHALTDSLWLKKDGATESDLRQLCETISRATGIEMALEGVYHWLVFLPSKLKSTRPVAARFFGVFADGTRKIRGLACRRHDTPRFITAPSLNARQCHPLDLFQLMWKGRIISTH